MTNDSDESRQAARTAGALEEGDIGEGPSPEGRYATAAGGEPAEAVLSCLGTACHEMGLPFEQATARRALSDAFRGVALDENPEEELYSRMGPLAAAWNLRANSLNLTVSEAAALVRPTAPLALLTTLPGGKLQWFIIADHRGRRVRLLSSIVAEDAKWISLPKLHVLLGAGGGEKRRWLALEPLLPCEPLHNEHDHGPSPLGRYLKLLGPERSDIGVITVFAIVVGLLSLSAPIAVEALVNTVAFGQFIQPVVVLAIILFVFLAFAAVMRAVQAYVAEIIQRRIFVRVASDLAQRLPRVRADFWRQHYGPELLNRFFDVATVQKVTSQLLLDGLALALQTLVGMTVIAFYHPLLLGFDAFLLVMIAVVIFGLGRGAVSTSIDESQKKYAMAAWLEELARHSTAFKSYSGVNFAVDQADRCVTGYLQSRSIHFRILMRQIIATLALQAVASTVLLGLGGWLVIKGQLTLGQLVAAELIVTVIVGSFAKIGKYLEGYYDLMAAMNKLGHLFDMPLDQRDGVELPRQERGLAVTLDELAVHETGIPGSALKQANARFAAGERVALVGTAGNLREQLMAVISGTSAAAYGHVEFDGYDLRRLAPQSKHGHIALIRNPEVFAGTVAENIHVGREDVSEEDIRLALASTCLLDEILDLPEGLSTQLDTDGRSLAHDELIRLMLARAVAARPRLILVDGALDALPDHLLNPVTLGVLQAVPNCTFIVSTGRQAVASFFDRHVDVAADGSLKELVVHPPKAPAVKRRSRRGRNVR